MQLKHVRAGWKLKADDWRSQLASRAVPSPNVVFSFVLNSHKKSHAHACTSILSLAGASAHRPADCPEPRGNPGNHRNSHHWLSLIRIVCLIAWSCVSEPLERRRLAVSRFSMRFEIGVQLVDRVHSNDSNSLKQSGVHLIS